MIKFGYDFDKTNTFARSSMVQTKNAGAGCRRGVQARGADAGCRRGVKALMCKDMLAALYH